jgi:hypothetical protein
MVGKLGSKLLNGGGGLGVEPRGLQIILTNHIAKPGVPRGTLQFAQEDATRQDVTRPPSANQQLPRHLPRVHHIINAMSPLPSHRMDSTSACMDAQSVVRPLPR